MTQDEKALALWNTLDEAGREEYRAHVHQPLPEDMVKQLLAAGLLVASASWVEGQSAEGPPYMPPVMREVIAAHEPL